MRGREDARHREEGPHHRVGHLRERRHQSVYERSVAKDAQESDPAQINGRHRHLAEADFKNIKTNTRHECEWGMLGNDEFDLCCEMRFFRRR